MRTKDDPPGLNRDNHTTSTGPQCGRGLGKFHGGKAVTGACLSGARSEEYLETELLSCTYDCGAEFLHLQDSSAFHSSMERHQL